jgi:hypothetical protein
MGGIVKSDFSRLGTLYHKCFIERYSDVVLFYEDYIVFENEMKSPSKNEFKIDETYLDYFD